MVFSCGPPTRLRSSPPGHALGPEACRQGQEKAPLESGSIRLSKFMLRTQTRFFLIESLHESA